MIPITAAGLGIDLFEDRERGLFQWLLASFLIGKRIRSTVAIEAYRNLVDRHGLNSPARLAGCSHREIVKLLGQAGYARYDESTARRLHQLGSRLEREMSEHIRLSDPEDVERMAKWLLSFDGIGPKTLEIFMREVRPLFDHAARTDEIRGMQR